MSAKYIGLCIGAGKCNNLEGAHMLVRTYRFALIGIDVDIELTFVMIFTNISYSYIDC